MNGSKVAPATKNDSYEFPFFSVRNITSPEDNINNRRVYVGHAPLSSIIDLPTDENVREYLAEAGKKRKYSGVHRAIMETLENNPDDFGVLNSGMVIVARHIEVDDKNHKAVLFGPSIINGSQTQGVIRDYRSKHRRMPESTSGGELHIKYEIIVAVDEDVIANVSIARNFQNEVLPISIVGRQGHLDELEERFRQKYPLLQIRKSETDKPYSDNNIVDTEKLIQVIAALVPPELWVKGGDFNKVYSYSQKTRCLRDFEEIYKRAKGSTEHPDYAKYAQLYQFYLDIAPQAYDLYEKWKKHPGFRGSRIRSIERDENRNIVDVPDGIIFPIIASLSSFASRGATGWTIMDAGVDADLVQTAATAYMEVANSNPNVMGKSKACYTSLLQITTLIRTYKLDKE
jgi:hypothetical protein